MATYYVSACKNTTIKVGAIASQQVTYSYYLRFRVSVGSFDTTYKRYPVNWYYEIGPANSSTVNTYVNVSYPTIYAWLGTGTTYSASTAKYAAVQSAGTKNEIKLASSIASYNSSITTVTSTTGWVSIVSGTTYVYSDGTSTAAFNLYTYDSKNFGITPSISSGTKTTTVYYYNSPTNTGTVNYTFGTVGDVSKLVTINNYSPTISFAATSGYTAFYKPAWSTMSVGVGKSIYLPSTYLQYKANNKKITIDYQVNGTSIGTQSVNTLGGYYIYKVTQWKSPEGSVYDAGSSYIVNKATTLTAYKVSNYGWHHWPYIEFTTKALPSETGYHYDSTNWSWSPSDGSAATTVAPGVSVRLTPPGYIEEALNGGSKTGAGNTNFATTNRSEVFTISKSANSFTLNFRNEANTSNLDTKTVTYGSAAPTPSVTPTKTGYTFDGWYFNSKQQYNSNNVAVGGNGLWNTNKVCNYTGANGSTINLLPQFKAGSYTVTLNNNSATTAGTTSVTAYYGSAMPTITPPTKTGYTFDGYFLGTVKYYNPNGSSAKNWDQAENKTLVASWTPIVREVVLNDNNGRGGMGTIYRKYGVGFYSDLACTNKIEYVTIPVKDGSIFTGYFSKSGSGTGVDNSGKIVASSSSVTVNTEWVAGWTDGIAVNFKCNGGSSEYGENFTKIMKLSTTDNNLLSSPYRTGYVFMGWYDATSGGNKAYEYISWNQCKAFPGTYWDTNYKWKYSSTTGPTLYAIWKRANVYSYITGITNMANGWHPIRTIYAFDGNSWKEVTFRAYNGGWKSGV